MTKQNRFYLLIATLSATMASSDATAVDCSDYYYEGEKYQEIVDTLQLNGAREYEKQNDWGDAGFCNLYDCNGDDVSYDEIDNGINTDICKCADINTTNIINHADVCGDNSECIQCVLGNDDNPSGSDGYIGGSDSPTPSWNCDNGYYHEEGGSGCTECPSYTDYAGYDFTINSGNGRDAIIDCFVPAGNISHTFTDKNNNTYTISIDTDCYYDE